MLDSFDPKDTAQLRAFYVTQRDKHLEQFMAINGRATFASLVLVASLLVVAGRVAQTGDLPVRVSPVCLATRSIRSFFVIVGKIRSPKVSFDRCSGTIRRIDAP